LLHDDFIFEKRRATAYVHETYLSEVRNLGSDRSLHRQLMLRFLITLLGRYFVCRFV